MPFKTKDEIDSFSKYKSGIKTDLARINATPMKFHYYEKFRFDEKVGPLLLIGDVPSKMLEDIGRAHV